MKKVLVVASVASMIGQFILPDLELLRKSGFQVSVACNFKEGNTCDEESVRLLKQYLQSSGTEFHQIDFDRNVFRFDRNKRAYIELLKLLKKNHYCFIHCHSPIGGVLGRITGAVTATKVIYTAHGFHFYRGAPLVNWLLFYPIEHFLAGYTEILITINREDYKIACKWKAGKVRYVPGIGINLEKYNSDPEEQQRLRKEKRKGLKVQDSAFVILSVGELNKNKNHISAIRALGKLKNENFHYFICGQGEKENDLKRQVKKEGLEKKITFLGYRNDIRELCLMSDLFVFPSYREGLSVSLMEAMAEGLPVVVSRIRGNTDLVTEGKGGYLIKNPSDCTRIAQAIKKLIRRPELGKKMGRFNQQTILKYSREGVNRVMKNIYGEIDNAI